MTNANWGGANRVSLRGEQGTYRFHFQAILKLFQIQGRDCFALWLVLFHFNTPRGGNGSRPGRLMADAVRHSLVRHGRGVYAILMARSVVRMSLRAQGAQREHLVVAR